MAKLKGREAPVQPTSYVTVIAEGDFEFIVPKEAALLSSTMRDMLSDETGMLESMQNRVELPTHSAEVVEKLCEYLVFKWHYEINKDEDVPAFEPRIPLELALQLLECADFLDS